MNGRRARQWGRWIVLVFLLGACTLPGNAAPVVKFGLIAPFEGEGRELGYAVLPVLKAIVAEANASGSLGAYRVAIVAVDDSLDPPTAARQARALASDADVLLIIGPFTRETSDAAGAVAQERGVPWIPAAGAPDGDVADEVRLATEAANAATAALAADISLHGRPSRSGVGAALRLP